MNRLKRWLYWQRRKWWAARLATRGWVELGKDVDIDLSVIVDDEVGGTLTIGDHCQIKQSVVLAPYGGSIRLGNRVFIGPGCVLYGHGGLTIGDNTLIAAQTVVIPANHTFIRCNVPIADQPMTTLGITIGADCWIGAGVRVLDGVTIGDGSVIGAGSVVVHSIPPMSVAVGVPAKAKKLRDCATPIGPHGMEVC